MNLKMETGMAAFRVGVFGNTTKGNGKKKTCTLTFGKMTVLNGTFDSILFQENKKRSFRVKNTQSRTRGFYGENVQKQTKKGYARRTAGGRKRPRD